MNGLRDLTSAKQSGLGIVANNVAQGNASLAEANVYKHQNMMGGPGPMNQMNPNAMNDWATEFSNNRQNRMPNDGIAMKVPHQPHQPQMNHARIAQEKMMNEKLQKEFENMNIQQQQHHPQQQQQQHHEQQMRPMRQMPMGPIMGQPMMGHPMNQFPMQQYGPPPPMMMQPQPQMRPQQQQPPQQQQEEQNKEKESKEDNGISTNGEQDLKDEKTVENELNNLNPTEDDVRAINELFRSTQNDPKMQQSQFFNLLKKIQEKPTIAQNGDINNQMADQWGQEFADWKDDQRLNNAHWENYLDAINPINKVESYKFDENNHFMQEINNINDITTTDNNNNITEEEKKDSEYYFNEGLRLQKEGNLNEAILAFEACISLSPNHSVCWRHLGICHADNENENNGILAFLKCIENDPYDLDALLQLGVSYTNEIDPHKALKYLTNWIANHHDYNVLKDELDNNNNNNNNNIEEKDPNSSSTWIGSRREHGKIVSLFNKALLINPNDCDLHIVLGVLYNITSDYNKAEHHFKCAIKVKPNDASLWNKLGATQANGQKCSEAIKAYSRALQLKPNYVRALSNLGISFANQSMHHEACQSYLASLERNKNAQSVWDHLIMSLIHMKRNDLVQLCDKRDPQLFKNYFKF